MKNFISNPLLRTWTILPIHRSIFVSEQRLAMMPVPEVDVSALLFYAVAYLCISFQFRQNRKSPAWAVVMIIAAFSVKLGYDFSSQSASHYSLLEVGRHSSALDIRRSYKRLIKIHHPDKNLDGGDVVFQRVKLAYDVLMDEEHRDLYNRFGGRSFDFDPRKDELRLITDVAVVYLFLGITAYLMTLPVGARASRTWLAILGIAMLAVEVTFKLTDTAMPEWMPAALTEHELVFYLHCLFPLAVALLRLLAEALYVDADQTALAVLKEVYIQQKGTLELLQQLQVLVDTDSSKTTTGDADGGEEKQLSGIQIRLGELREQLEQAGDNTALLIEDLRQCAANPGSQYYFVVFIVLYGGIYFLQ